MKQEKDQAPQQEAPEEQAAPQQEQAAGQEASEDRRELEKLQAEFEAHKEQHLRVLAEYDNFRKRTAAEKTSLYNNAVADTVKEILPIADNIQRALSPGECLRRGHEKGRGDDREPDRGLL